ncbi:MAG TPA: hypothetical protein VE442_13330 [Jatrophihabitans sp.]|jgi:hypothetical protein|nr:hypothetical protein [Jatrophihabitans sp.]
MFVQVIQAKVKDEAGLRSALDTWRDRLLPGAAGYLGTTGGITEDGIFIALARFADADSAKANSERPEQGEWWTEVEKNLEGAVDFLDCDDVTAWLDGGSDDAGFVQIMRGRSEDVARMHSLFNKHTAELREARPEIIGGLMLDAGDGRYVDAIYFASEEAARKGEALEPPEQVRADMEEGMQLMGEVSYFDLRDPILVSP